MMEKQQYPIGQYQEPELISHPQREEWITVLEGLPKDLEKRVQGLSAGKLATRYRPGGWTVRQVVHHLADSHMNAYFRFKLALTLDNPQILAYPEDKWALLSDGKEGDIEPSLLILKGVHQRWGSCLRHVKEEEWSRTFFHPEHQRSFRLDTTLGMYVWHGCHHLAHIENALES